MTKGKKTVAFFCYLIIRNENNYKCIATINFPLFFTFLPINFHQNYLLNQIANHQVELRFLYHILGSPPGLPETVLRANNFVMTR